MLKSLLNGSGTVCESSPFNNPGPLTFVAWLPALSQTTTRAAQRRMGELSRENSALEKRNRELLEERSSEVRPPPPSVSRRRPAWLPEVGSPRKFPHLGARLSLLCSWSAGCMA